MTIDHRLAFDIAHLLSGSMVVLSFALLYQRRLHAAINIVAAQAAVLSLAVAWQALVQDAPQLFLAAGLVLAVHAAAVPMALHAIVERLDIRRSAEAVIGVVPTMLAGLALVGLSVAAMLPATGASAAIARDELTFALSVLLLGLLIMITRRNLVMQVVGFTSVEAGLILAAAGVPGMPLVIGIVAVLLVLAAFVVAGIFFFRLHERLDAPGQE